MRPLYFSENLSAEQAEILAEILEQLVQIVVTTYWDDIEALWGKRDGFESFDPDKQHPDSTPLQHEHVDSSDSSVVLSPAHNDFTDHDIPY